MHGGAALWDALLPAFPQFQIVLTSPNGTLEAAGHAAPFWWDGHPATLPAGLPEILERALEDRKLGRVPNTLCAMAAMVDASSRGRGLSAAILSALKTVAARHGMAWLAAPVRPTLKHRYPLIPIERYARWTRPDGSPFDPWIRTHWKMGARSLGPAPRVLTVSAPVKRWEEWTGLAFPETGDYVVEGAMQPVRIDRGAGLGLYEESGFWMCHPAAGSLHVEREHQGQNPDDRADERRQKDLAPVELAILAEPVHGPAGGLGAQEKANPGGHQDDQRLG